MLVRLGIHLTTPHYPLPMAQHLLIPLPASELFSLRARVPTVQLKGHFGAKEYSNRWARAWMHAIREELDFPDAPPHEPGSYPPLEHGVSILSTPAPDDSETHTRFWTRPCVGLPCSRLVCLVSVAGDQASG